MSQLAVVSDVIIPKPENFVLCQEAEPIFAQALNDEALVAVNGFMLVNVAYSVFGIPLHEFETPGGRFETNWWYKPRSAEDQGQFTCRPSKQIRDAFLNGVAAIDLPGTTNWMPLRKVREKRLRLHGEVLTEKAIRIAAALQNVGPLINGVTREEYLHKNSY